MKNIKVVYDRATQELLDYADKRINEKYEYFTREQNATDLCKYPMQKRNN